MTSPSEKHQALFSALVASYSGQAMICLGKIANPQTGEIERDLDQASMFIDMLQMLEARTEGNLTDDESSALRQSLSMLRLNFVEEKNKPATSEAADDDAATDEAPEDASNEASEGSAAGSDRASDQPHSGAPGA